jgi:hypothetical protein
MTITIYISIIYKYDKGVTMVSHGVTIVNISAVYCDAMCHTVTNKVTHLLTIYYKDLWSFLANVTLVLGGTLGK